MGFRIASCQRAHERAKMGATSVQDGRAGVSSDLRRPSDQPRPPDEPPSDPPDRPPRLSDSYVDDPDDIFDTADIPKDCRDSLRQEDAFTEGGGEHDANEAVRAVDDTGNGPDDPPNNGPGPDADADEPFSFDPRRAGLEDITAEEAVAYIAANKVDRPWLAAAEGQHPQVQRVYAALDKGQGHAIPRHDDYGSNEMYERRVQYLEDPAQLDDAKRSAGIDGCKPGDKKHYCAEYATRIHDATTFATAFARAVEIPAVRAALETPVGGEAPDEIAVPTAELLGDDGHLYCSGYQLAGDDPKQAVKDRKAWLNGERHDDLAEPQTESIPTFQGGEIEFRFRLNRAGSGYEISTMFPQPPEPR